MYTNGSEVVFLWLVTRVDMHIWYRIQEGFKRVLLLILAKKTSLVGYNHYY